MAGVDCNYPACHCAIKCDETLPIERLRDKAAGGKVLRPDNDQSNKADGGKSNPLLIEVDLAEALMVVNRVLDYGAEKYVRAGWMNVDPERYNSAARRHRRDRDIGKIFDDESGLVHLAHEATNVLFQLQMFIKAHPEIDFLTYKKPPQGHKLSGSNQNEKRKVS